MSNDISDRLFENGEATLTERAMYLGIGCFLVTTYVPFSTLLFFERTRERIAVENSRTSRFHELSSQEYYSKTLRGYRKLTSNFFKAAYTGNNKALTRDLFHD